MEAIARLLVLVMWMQATACYCALTYCMFFLTAGGTVGKAGSRADEGRGDYQERAAADSGDETKGGSSVCGGVCFLS